MKKVLLWIAVLPGAILGACLITLIVHFINLWGQDIEWDWVNVVTHWIVKVIDGILFPVAFVGCGILIAPSLKRETGVFLVSMMVCYLIGILILCFSYNYKFTFSTGWLFFITHFIGCGFALLYIPKEDKS